jgi:hypothetical protein
MIFPILGAIARICLSVSVGDLITDQFKNEPVRRE